jgi:acyl transferase domain-containing protein
MSAFGIHRFAEVGPGDVLTRLVRWTLRDAIVARPALERPEDVHVFAATLAPAPAAPARLAAAPSAPERA